ncbi:histone-lysine N-methyltransferase ASHR1 isoform X2 [Olea europaea var. sylvestris]|uniref:histone-lysine N-methyltransferase ASHR1 isoform X2 n=1 Tax=Olea europaea var. sylvestris TaxID=158386 RepID=UPI000C1CE5E5|nr:histone-lysine N-methyltransferase ASHR1 isoform X2 [Olea europaea var. sylvestris]
MEELQKALNDKNLTVSSLPEKGRCLFTTRDLFPGEVILSEDPYVSVPNKNKESPNSKCEWCFSSSKLKKCSGCHVVWYCGGTCQKLDWKLHSVECKALAKVDKNRVKSITPSIRLMVKLYLRRKLQQQKIIPTTATDNYNLIEPLVSHMPDLEEKQLVLYAQIANLVALILQWPESEIDIKEIAENFSKLSCNAHSICDSELRPLGTGLYPVISIINHSCLPNSVLVFEGRLAVVRAVQHIPKGAEFVSINTLHFEESLILSCQWLPKVSISYVETAGSTITRQKALREQYFFSCTCSRCLKMGQVDDIEESAILEGYRCKDRRCNGFLLHDSDNKGFICQHCGLLRSKEEIENIAIEVRSMSEKASMAISSGNNTQANSAYKMIEKLQLELCHPYSINLMRTRETILKILMELQDWKEALVYCRLTIPIYIRAYPPFHPLVGLQYYTCGKLEWLLGETEEAVKSLTKAFNVLRITHGTKTPFMMELLSKLDEARAEVSYKRSSQNED